MRITITLDPDVAQQLESCRATSPLSQKVLVNQALGLGLSSLKLATRNAVPFKVRPFKDLRFRPGIDEGRLNQLVDELDTQAQLAKMAE